MRHQPISNVHIRVVYHCATLQYKKFRLDGNKHLFPLLYRWSIILNRRLLLIVLICLIRWPYLPSSSPHKKCHLSISACPFRFFYYPSTVRNRWLRCLVRWVFSIRRWRILWTETIPIGGRCFWRLLDKVWIIIQSWIWYWRRFRR